MNISGSLTLFQQRRCGRKLQVEQRRIVVKNGLVKSGERVTTRADGVKQLQGRAFADLQCIFGRCLDVVDLCQNAAPIKLDTTFLQIESHKGFVDVADYLIRSELFLILS